MSFMKLSNVLFALTDVGLLRPVHLVWVCQWYSSATEPPGQRNIRGWTEATSFGRLLAVTLYQNPRLVPSASRDTLASVFEASTTTSVDPPVVDDTGELTAIENGASEATV